MGQAHPGAWPATRLDGVQGGRRGLQVSRTAEVAPQPLEHSPLTCGKRMEAAPAWPGLCVVQAGAPQSPAAGEAGQAAHLHGHGEPDRSGSSREPV